MNSFAPYDLNTKPDTPNLYKTALTSTNVTTASLCTPQKKEAEECTPLIHRRTIRVGRDQTPDPLKEINDQKELNLYSQHKRYKESYSLNNGRGDSLYGETRTQIYKTQAMSSQPNISKAQAIDPAAIKQLLSLQMQLQQNPNLIQQTQSLLENLNSSQANMQGSVKSQNNNLVHAMSELDRDVSALRVENSKLRQSLNDLEYELDNAKQQLDIEKNKAESLANDLENHQELRDKVDELTLEVQKLEGERDYHHKNHVDLRKELYNKTNAEFQINKLKRELFYRNEEHTTIKERCAELEWQINELLVFAEKPRNEKQNNAETFYAKKIVELENTIKKLKDEKFEIENFHNTSLDNRRGLFSGTDISKADKPSDIGRITQLEVETLKRKIDTLKSENEFMKRQLENARGAKRADSFSGMERDNHMAKDYIKQIEDLKAEVRRLKSQVGQGDTSRMDDFYLKTIEDQKQKISTLQQEKTTLQIKIDTLNRELMEKAREISELKQGNALGVGNETVDYLRDANKRMTIEIGRLQDQLRRMESLNKTSMISSSMDKGRDWNKLLK